MAPWELLPAMGPKQWTIFAQLPQYGSLDDVAAMAVFATLTVLYLFKGIMWNQKDPYLYKMYERPQQLMRSEAASQSSRNIAIKMEQMVCG